MELLTNEVFLITINLLFLLLALVVGGIAIWRSVKLGQRNWYIVLIISMFLALPLRDLTLIIGIAYLFFFAKKKLTSKEIKSWMQKIKKVKSK